MWYLNGPKKELTEDNKQRIDVYLDADVEKGVRLLANVKKISVSEYLAGLAGKCVKAKAERIRKLELREPARLAVLKAQEEKRIERNRKKYLKSLGPYFGRNEYLPACGRLVYPGKMFSFPNSVYDLGRYARLKFRTKTDDAIPAILDDFQTAFRAIADEMLPEYEACLNNPQPVFVEEANRNNISEFAYDKYFPMWKRLLELTVDSYRELDVNSTKRTLRILFDDFDGLGSRLFGRLFGKSGRVIRYGDFARYAKKRKSDFEMIVDGGDGVLSRIICKINGTGKTDYWVNFEDSRFNRSEPEKALLELGYRNEPLVFKI